MPYLRNMLLKRVITFFITFLILFADSGQMIYAHTCFKSNHTSFSLYTPDHCCAKEEEVAKSCCAKKATEEKKNCALGKMSCCSVSAKYVKQSFPNNEIKLTASEVVKQITIQVKLFEVYTSTFISKLFFQSSPPVLPGKDDIRFTQVFRI